MFHRAIQSPSTTSKAHQFSIVTTDQWVTVPEQLSLPLLDSRYSTAPALGVIYLRVRNYYVIPLC